MIVRAVFRCDSLRVSLWSTICPFVWRLKKTEEKGPERRSPKGGCCSFFFQFFFKDIFNVHSKKISGDDHLCWWSSPFFIQKGLTFERPFHFKGSDFWKAFQRLWLFNVLFLATTVLVDGRRLYTFKRVWPFKGSDFSMYIFIGDDHLSWWSSPLYFQKGIPFERVWLFNAFSYSKDI